MPLEQIETMTNWNLHYQVQTGFLLPSSAQVPALAVLRWLYFQLIQPPTHPV